MEFDFRRRSLRRMAKMLERYIGLGEKWIETASWLSSGDDGDGRFRFYHFWPWRIVSLRCFVSFLVLFKVKRSICLIYFCAFNSLLLLIYFIIFRICEIF